MHIEQRGLYPFSPARAQCVIVPKPPVAQSLPKHLSFSLLPTDRVVKAMCSQNFHWSAVFLQAASLLEIQACREECPTAVLSKISFSPLN